MPGPTTAAEAAAIAAAQAQVGADYIASENVEFVRSFNLAPTASAPGWSAAAST